MFKRWLVSKDGNVGRPTRVGDGLLAHLKAKVYAAEDDATITVAELAGGLILQGTTLTSDVTYTLPTAALILAAKDADAMDIGDTMSFVVTNSQEGAFDVVIAVGTGITAVGANNSLSVPPQCSRIFTLEKSAAATMNLY